MRIRAVNAIKYKGILHPAGKEFDVPDDMGNQLVDIAKAAERVAAPVGPEPAQSAEPEKAEGDGDEPDGKGDENALDLSKATKAELVAECEARGVEIPKGATKATLVELLVDSAS